MIEPEWVGAIGTCAGALGTVYAVMKAVSLSKQERLAAKRLQAQIELNHYKIEDLDRMKTVTIDKLDQVHKLKIAADAISRQLIQNAGKFNSEIYDQSVKFSRSLNISTDIEFSAMVRLFDQIVSNDSNEKMATEKTVGAIHFAFVDINFIGWKKLLDCIDDTKRCFFSVDSAHEWKQLGGGTLTDWSLLYDELLTVIEFLSAMFKQENRLLVNALEDLNIASKDDELDRQKSSMV